ncbi:hypothetical protein GCM10027278_18100 [Paralcaligenes ginsengisoli]
MSDGCWVQFWDHNDFAEPTRRIDAEGPTKSVNNMDDYKQSDGDKLGDEPDSLKRVHALGCGFTRNVTSRGLL